MDYLYIGLTLQSTSIFLITMIASIVIALRGEKIKNIYLTFFIIGAFASFMDFLTVPIISLRIATYSLFLENTKRKRFKHQRNNKNSGICINFMGNCICIDMDN